MISNPKLDRFYNLHLYAYAADKITLRQFLVVLRFVEEKWE